jgi:porin
MADDTEKQRLTGNWGGLCTDLEQAGIDLEFNYTSEIAYNAAGGSKHAVRYTDRWAFSGSFDLERLSLPIRLAEGLRKAGLPE